MHIFLTFVRPLELAQVRGDFVVASFVMLGSLCNERAALEPHANDRQSTSAIF
jgi:hypothetical protein